MGDRPGSRGERPARRGRRGSAWALSLLRLAAFKCRVVGGGRVVYESHHTPYTTLTHSHTRRGTEIERGKRGHQLEVTQPELAVG